MSDIISIRFAENQFYDVHRDAEVIMLMAITNLGTWHSTVAIGKASEVRTQREAFKEYCLHSIAQGGQPKEVNLGG